MTEDIVVLHRADARRCAELLDPVAVVESVLRRHADGQVLLPAEGYMAWNNSQGAYSRSIAMLGALTGSDPVYGLKLINAAVSNPAEGMERAGGISVVFDPETARPRFIAEAGYLSGLRTAAYTIASLRTLGPERIDEVALIGCGALARAHLELITRYLPDTTGIHLFDLDAARSAELRSWTLQRWPHLTVSVAPTARACARAAGVVVFLTVSDEPYAGLDWFRPGAFVAHVSLDDLRPDVFAGAEAVFVDDVGLIRDNPRRILGRLIQEGVVLPPDGTAADGGRALNGTLGEVLLGRRAPVRPTGGVVVSNPFGMSVLDVAMVAEVRRVATETGLGQRVDLLGE